jgi:hypothetical protein
MFLEVSEDTLEKLNCLEQAKVRVAALLELTRLQTFFLSAMSERSSDSVLNQNEISKHLQTVALQIELTKFLNTHRKEIAPEVLRSSIYGNNKQKAEIAEQLIMLGNYDLVFRVLQEFRLPTLQVFISATSKLASRKILSKLNDALKSLKGMVPDDDWDSVVKVIVKVYKEEHHDEKTAEKFASRLTSDQAKIDSMIEIGTLKQAYILAAKMNSVPAVERILAEAERTGAKNVVTLCMQFLKIK